MNSGRTVFFQRPREVEGQAKDERGDLVLRVRH